MSTTNAAMPPGGGTGGGTSEDANRSNSANAGAAAVSSASSTTPRDTKNGVMQSFPPSHILEDGRLIYLPPPNALERTRFFERSIARHGLLQADMEQTEDRGVGGSGKDASLLAKDEGGGQSAENGAKDDTKSNEQIGETNKNDDNDNDNDDTTAPKVHPLAIASARLQSNGLNELNRAINLATLVQSKEFFSYTNIVDPSLEAQTAVPTSAKPAVVDAEGSSKEGAAASSSEDTSTAKRTEALFSLKRKRGQFERASRVLERHEARLWAGIRAQKVIDRRLFQLRQQWRLVAPEHGTRAKLHAARTNEVIAVDVDVYDRDRVHGGNQALMGGRNNNSRLGLAGRLASRVPRFATIELRDDFRLPPRDNHGAGDDDGNDSGNGNGKQSVETKPGQDESGEEKDETDTGNLTSSSADTTIATGNTTNKKPESSSNRDQEMKDADTDKKEEKSDGDDGKKDAPGSETKDSDNGDAVMTDATSVSKNPDAKEPPPSGDDATKDTEDESYAARWTRAEPYAVADPTLGRVIENFDPSKIPMLNLQLDIQKSSTGFRQSACLEPMTTLSSAKNSDNPGESKNSNSNSNSSNSNNNSNSNIDEELLISLQHSLFCANLFESMRSELDPEPTNGPGANQQQQSRAGGNSFSVRPKKSLQKSMAWLASESDENFVASPSFLVGGDAGRGLAPLSVVHCHEGEVKVQLDSEYQLCLKLVEANLEQTVGSKSKSKSKASSDAKNSKHGSNHQHSGSQSPARLHAFCRALLLYAQDVYHKHSLYLHEREKKMRADEVAKGDGPRGLARIKKEDAPEKARILQSCVSLGSKMLFEQRVRKAISRVSEWLLAGHGEKLSVEWLSLSAFDLHSKFTLYCKQLVVDGMIARDVLTVTKIDEETEEFRKVHFRTEKEFELYLKLELRRQM